jgi:nicotinate-nucleotide pyrophosphorylase (carboxylating)
VRCGGASNHRIGLFDAILIKENHIAAVGSIEAAIARARAAAGDRQVEIEVEVEVEVETMEQVERALGSKADRLLLDNFSPQSLREAVQLRNRLAARQKLEASGGISLANVRDVALTGVDYISVGALTKNVAAVDFSLRIVHAVA